MPCKNKFLKIRFYNLFYKIQTKLQLTSKLKECKDLTAFEINMNRLKTFVFSN